LIGKDTHKTIMINEIYISNEQKFNEWLAGLIDGDGCLLIAQERYASCEITMGINDHHTLIFKIN